MSNLNDLQDFIEKQRSKSSDEEMIEANIKAVEDARAKGKSTLTLNQQKIVSRMREERPKTEEIPLMEKDGGGGGGAGGAGGAGGLAGGGTVAVASDPGVFTNTYGGDSKRRLGMTPAKKKKKKKKGKKEKEKDKAITSGVTKLDRFLRGEKVNQTRKSVSVQEFATWLVEDALVKDLDPTRRRPGVGGVPENYVDDIPTGKSRPSKPRLGTPAKGQSEFKNFEKMENVSKVLETGGSILNLMKAIDMDIPVEVH
jgi:hypothetical protein